MMFYLYYPSPGLFYTNKQDKKPYVMHFENLITCLMYLPTRTPLPTEADLPLKIDLPTGADLPTETDLPIETLA